MLHPADAAQTTTSTFADLLKTVGGLAGIAALAWRVVDEFGSHLRIALKVDEPKDGWVTALTTVDNKGNRPKAIEYAMLLIGPEEESPTQTAETLAKLSGHAERFPYTNNLTDFVLTEPLLSVGRAILPVPFYYSENVDIADETLTFRVPLNVSGWETGKPYAVRFFLFPKGRMRLHRCTEDCFVIKSKASIVTET